MTRTVLVGLKIPDNTAYTALVTLRRLGIPLERIERNHVYTLEAAGEAETLAAHIETDETIFNPNLHRLAVVDGAVPRAGELWIEPLRARVGPSGVEERHAVAWRLFEKGGAPARRQTLAEAAEKLLCNPAIDRAVF